MCKKCVTILIPELYSMDIIAVASFFMWSQVDLQHHNQNQGVIQRSCNCKSLTAHPISCQFVNIHYALLRP